MRTCHWDYILLTEILFSEKPYPRQLLSTLLFLQMYQTPNTVQRIALPWDLLGPSCSASFLLTLPTHCSMPWLPDSPQSTEGKCSKPRAATTVLTPLPSSCFTHVLLERSKAHQDGMFCNRTTNFWEKPHRKYMKLKKMGVGNAAQSHSRLVSFAAQALSVSGTLALGAKVVHSLQLAMWLGWHNLWLLYEQGL